MKYFIFLFVTIFNSLMVFSQGNLLGKKAPAIEVDKWIYPNMPLLDWHEKSVSDSLDGNIIVLDFWFTACAPCVASIPELNSLAKKFPEIDFLSVSFDSQDIIENFLRKMIMYYPVGSDPEMKTIKAFNVDGFPLTFVIDKNGLIQWYGSPFNLNDQVLNKALGRDNETEIVAINNSEIRYEHLAYSFSITEHYLDMGQSSFHNYNPYSVNILNKDLEYMLQLFYGINKSRILTTDTVLLNTKYDITLKVDKDVSTEANSGEILKYLLQKELHLEMKEIYLDSLIGIIKTENDSVLNMHLSNSDLLGTTKRFGNWEATGATLSDLLNFIENEYNLIMLVDQDDRRKFDFILPLKDIEKVKETLYKNYGISIIWEKRKTRFWKIDRSKVK